MLLVQKDFEKLPWKGNQFDLVGGLNHRVAVLLQYRSRRRAAMMDREERGC